MNRNFLRYLIFFAGFFALIIHSEAFAEDAVAHLYDYKGSEAGIVNFSENNRGVKIDISIRNLMEGEHAFHIHETGDCKRPDFKSAGGHFNPMNSKHGFLNPKGAHAGDLPNIIIDEKGRARRSWTTKLVTLKEGEKESLFRGRGTAIVIHKGADDYITDPAGAAGKRIACGVIKPIK